MATLNVGQFYPATVTASDGSTVPPGTVVGSSDNAAATVGPADQNNVLIVTGAAPGSANITYSAPGFLPVTESVTVNKLQAKLVVTDGPVQG